MAEINLLGYSIPIDNCLLSHHDVLQNYFRQLIEQSITQAQPVLAVPLACKTIVLIWFLSCAVAPANLQVKVAVRVLEFDVYTTLKECNTPAQALR